MNSIKGFYEKAELSEVKKSELKSALRQRFPQYAENDGGITEVTYMNNMEINSRNSGRVTVRRKWTAGIVAAALLLTVGGGMILAKRAYMQRALAGAEGETEDTAETEVGTNDNDTDPNDTEDTQKTGYTNKGHKKQQQEAKVLYRSAAVVCSDIHDNCYEFDITEETVVTADDVKAVAGKKLQPQDNKVDKEIFASMLYEEYGGEDISSNYYEVTFMFDESYNCYLPKYAYIYLDDEHTRFTTYPIYGSVDETQDDPADFSLTRSSADAKTLYEEADSVLEKCRAYDVAVMCDTVKSGDFMEGPYYDTSFDYESETVMTAQDFANEIYTLNGVGYWIIYSGYSSYGIDFETDENGAVTGIKNVKVAFTDGNVMESYSYPEETGDTVSDDTGFVDPDVGRDDN